MYNIKRHYNKKKLLILCCFVCLLCFNLFFNGCNNKNNLLINDDIKNENTSSENNEEKEYIEINLTTDSLNIYKSDKFVLLKDVIPNIIESIKYSGYENFIGKPIAGYESNVAILTREAANALKNANYEFNKLGFGIIVYDAYRPVRAVKEFVDWTKNSDDVKMKNKFYPNVNKSDMIKNGYISEKSSHSRGSTIDLSLYYLTNLNILDMGGEFDYFGEKSHYDYNGFDIYEYHGNVDIDNPLNNLQLENNLFMNKIENYIDKQKNIENFLSARSYYDDNFISEMVFDEKGYVTKLYKYVRE